MYTSKFVLMIAAVTSLTIALTGQEQDVSAFNDGDIILNQHSHTQCKKGECGGQDGSIYNDENSHCNNNFNPNRPDPPRTNCFDKPDNGK